MFESMLLRRAGLASVPLLIGVASCDSVLGIEEPRERETEGAGAPSTAGTASGGNNANLAPEGGAGGEAGSPSVATPGGAADGGAAGFGGFPECEPDQVRCAGDGENVPERCDASGHWQSNADENGGEACPSFCSAGVCVECVKDATQCTSCEEGDPECNPRQRQKCVGGEWTNEGPACAHYCDAGECQTPASCAISSDSRSRCSDDGESCCYSLLVPGGTFSRQYDVVNLDDDSFKATLSPFFLDKFEVTVGRMKQFVAAFENFRTTLKDGLGRSSYVVGDPGWNVDYPLPADAAALVEQLKSCPGATWSDTEDNVRLPINCVSFPVAAAFCIWDGGRLPTDAEWNFAAAGGSQQRAVPWGGAIVSPEYARYSELSPSAVGVTPKGDARWGHADVCGNVGEWVLDYYTEVYPSECTDCLESTPSSGRVVRGSSFETAADLQLVVFSYPAVDEASTTGFRCAREVKKRTQ